MGMETVSRGMACPWGSYYIWGNTLKGAATAAQEGQEVCCPHGPRWPYRDSKLDICLMPSDILGRSLGDSSMILPYFRTEPPK